MPGQIFVGRKRKARQQEKEKSKAAKRTKAGAIIRPIDEIDWKETENIDK